MEKPPGGALLIDLWLFVSFVSFDFHSRELLDATHSISIFTNLTECVQCSK